MHDDLDAILARIEQTHGVADLAVIALRAHYERQAFLRALAWMDGQRWPWDREHDPMARRRQVDERRAARERQRRRRRAWGERLLHWLGRHSTTLPPREMDVALCWARGLSVAKTATKLGCTTGTVRALRPRVIKRLPVVLRPLSYLTAA